MIKLYIYNMNEMDLENEVLPDNVILRSCKSETYKKQKLASFKAVKDVFGDDVKLKYNHHGKPYVTNKEGFFNISHSNDFLVLATSDKEVGVDIEKKREIENRKLLLLERRTLINKPTSEGFLQEWTIRESYLKLLGIGLRVDLKTFVVDYDEGTISVANHQKANFKTFIKDDYFITIASFDKIDYEILDNLK